MKIEDFDRLDLARLIENAQRAYQSMDDAKMSEAEFIADFLSGYGVESHIDVIEFEKADDALPCPFCGGTEIVVEQYLHTVGSRWRIWCASCMAGVDPGYAQNKYTVLEMWNKRRKVNEQRER